MLKFLKNLFSSKVDYEPHSDQLPLPQTKSPGGGTSARSLLWQIQ